METNTPTVLATINNGNRRQQRKQTRHYGGIAEVEQDLWKDTKEQTQEQYSRNISSTTPLQTTMHTHYYTDNLKLLCSRELEKMHSKAYNEWISAVKEGCIMDEAEWILGNDHTPPRNIIESNKNKILSVVHSLIRNSIW